MHQKCEYTVESLRYHGEISRDYNLENRWELFKYLKKLNLNILPHDTQRKVPYFTAQMHKKIPSEENRGMRTTWWK